MAYDNHTLFSGLQPTNLVWVPRTAVVCHGLRWTGLRSRIGSRHLAKQGAPCSAAASGTLRVDPLNKILELIVL